LKNPYQKHTEEMDEKTYHSSCDKDVTQTNLLLAQILMKTTSDSTNLTENPQLLTVIRSLCNSSELFFSRPTPLQLKKDFIVDSRAINDSTSTFVSSLSMPSSVHVEDVTHDICHAYERSASHGVSATANETNVMIHEIPIISEGLSSVSTTQADSRKRPVYTSNGDSVDGHLSKRTFQGNIDVEPTSSEAAITCLADLTSYVEETMVKTEVLKNAYGILDNAKEGTSVIGIVFIDITLLIQSHKEHQSRPI
jgi:hypothetical protein